MTGGQVYQYEEVNEVSQIQEVQSRGSLLNNSVKITSEKIKGAEENIL